MDILNTARNKNIIELNVICSSKSLQKVLYLEGQFLWTLLLPPLGQAGFDWPRAEAAGGENGGEDGGEGQAGQDQGGAHPGEDQHGAGMLIIRRFLFTYLCNALYFFKWWNKLTGPYYTAASLIVPTFVNGSTGNCLFLSRSRFFLSLSFSWHLPDPGHAKKRRRYIEEGKKR